MNISDLMTEHNVITILNIGQKDEDQGAEIKIWTYFIIRLQLMFALILSHNNGIFVFVFFLKKR